MRKHALSLWVIIVIYLISIGYFSQACANDLIWTSDLIPIGLDSLRINTINFNHRQTFILAGTDKGIFVKSDTAAKWNALSNSFFTGKKVIDIEISQSSGLFIAAIVRESDSSGCIVIGKPTNSSPWYSLTKCNTLKNLQSIAFWGDSDSIVCAGSGNQIYRCHKLLNGSYSDMEQIVVPDKCFGESEPHCADIKYWKEYNVIYAGGYDSKNPDYQSSLFYYNTDSGEYKETVKMGVKSISFSENIRIPGPELISAATVMPGVMFYSSFGPNQPNYFPQLIYQSTNDSIRSIASLKIGYITRSTYPDLAFAATPHGAFFSYSGYSGPLKEWRIIGSKPLDAFSLCLMNGNPNYLNSFVLYIGTSQGVYKIGGYIPTTEINQISCKNNFYRNFINSSANNTVHYKVPPGNQKTLLELYAISGRKIKTLVNAYKQAGEYSLSLKEHNIAPGLYYIRALFDVNDEIQKITIIR